MKKARRNRNIIPRHTIGGRACNTANAATDMQTNLSSSPSPQDLPSFLSCPALQIRTFFLLEILNNFP
jgi:hypothetical protein